MKRFIILILGTVTIGSFAANVDMERTTGTTKTNQPQMETRTPMTVPTEAELLSVIDSDDFKNMAKEMGIDVNKMSPKEKADIAKEARGFAQEFTKLPPETQAEFIKEMSTEQPTKEIETELPPPAALPTPPPLPLPKAEPAKKEQAKPTVSPARLAEGKKMINKLVKYLEDIELKFGSLARVSPDPLREQRWAHLENDLEWTVAALHSMSNNPTLLEHFASTDSQVLYSQVHGMQRSLKSLRKKLVVPDTAKLRTPTGMDAARADVVSDPVKEKSKRTATTIIDTLGRDLPSISMGTKKLFETYAADELKKLEAKVKTPKPAIVERKDSMYKPGGSGYNGGHGSRDNYSPSSYSYPPYYSPSSSDYGRSGYGPGASGSSDAQGAGKDQELKDKEKKEAQEKAEKDKKGHADKDKDKKEATTDDSKTGKERDAQKQKREKYDSKAALSYYLGAANDQAKTLVEAGKKFIEEPTAENADAFLDKLSLTKDGDPKVSQYARDIDGIKHFASEWVEENKRSTKALDDVYDLLQKNSKLKEVGELYSTYRKKHTREARAGHQGESIKKALESLEYYEQQYDDILTFGLTQQRVEALKKEAQDELNKRLEKETAKMISKKTDGSWEFVRTVSVNDIDHALILLERLVKVAGKLHFDNIEARREQMNTLFETREPIGYFATQVASKLHAMTPVGDTLADKVVKEAIQELSKRETDLQARITSLKTGRR